MQIKTKVYNNSLYVLLIGELDECCAPYVRTTLDNVFETEKTAPCIPEGIPI